jgi:hypothetical protein
MPKTIRGILSKVFLHGVKAERMDLAPLDDVGYTLGTDQALSDLKTLLNEMVGDNEPMDYEHKDIEIENGIAEIRNQLRAEMRRAIKEMCK